MTVNTMDAATAAAVRQQVSKNWWILLVQGIATVRSGVLLLVNPPATVTAIAWVLGIFWVVGGVMDIIGAFTGRSNRHWFWQILGGALGVVAGLLLMVYPQASAAIGVGLLTLLVGIAAALAGVFNIIGAIVMRKEINGEFWMIIWGIILLLLGIWAIFNLGSAAFLYLAVIAILMIVGGIASIFGAFRLRSLGH